MAELAAEPELLPPLVAVPELEPAVELEPTLEAELDAELELDWLLAPVLDTTLELDPAVDAEEPPSVEPLLLDPLVVLPAEVLLPPMLAAEWQMPSSPQDRPAGHACVRQLVIDGTGTVQPTRPTSGRTHPKRLTT